MLLKGQIKRLPDKGKDGLLLVAETDEDYVPFRVRQSSPKQPPYRGLVRMEGSYGGKVFMVDRWERIGRSFSPEDLESLLKKGLRLSREEIEKILEGFERARVFDIIDIARRGGEEWEKAVVKLEDILGKERGNLVAGHIDRLVRDIASDEVRRYFESRGLGGVFDYPGYAAIVDFLKHRAGRRHKSVVALLEKDPYLLVHVPDLLPREDLLKVAASLDGGKIGSAKRILGIINLLLWREVEDGHLYEERGKLFKQTMARFIRLHEQENKVKFPPQAATDLKTLINKVMFRLDEERQNPDNGLWSVDEDGKIGTKLLYFKALYYAEKWIAEYLAEVLQKSSGGIGVQPEKLIEKARVIAAQMGLKWKEELDDFLRSTANKRITLLDGEAGSGKSTAVALLVRAYRDLTGKEPFLVAPTGIAAQRAAQKAGISKYATIHRFAHIAESDKDFAAADGNGGAPPAKREKVDLVIVDEAGMMDIFMLYRLLSRPFEAEEACHFVFVGDSGQLPAVGPGDAFKMLLTLGDSFPGAIGRWQLTEVERQGNKSDILTFARAVRRGDLQTVDDILTRAARKEIKEIEVIDCESEQVFNKTIERALQAFQSEGSDVQILTPRKQENWRPRSDLSAATLNDQLKGLLNPGSLAGTGLFTGDPVICIKNDYLETDFNAEEWRKMPRRIRDAQKYRARRPTIFNGMRGTVKGLSQETGNEETLVVEYTLPNGEKLEAHYYPDETDRYLSLAYALTVHKAQGGEAKEVIIAASEAGGFGRELLYTAVTRAKEKLTLIGPRKLWLGMVQAFEEPRRSLLVKKVLQAASPNEPLAQDQPADLPDFARQL